MLWRQLNSKFLGSFDQFLNKINLLRPLYGFRQQPVSKSNMTTAADFHDDNLRKPFNINFDGKVVLITGASSGIGSATAVLFSKLGASLALTGRNTEALNAVVEECKKHSKREPFIFKAELTNEADTQNLVEAVLNHYKQLDVLVNNAGILESGSIENTSLQQYDKVFNTNVRSVYHLTMLMVPHLKKTKGAIINVSSVNGLRSYAGVLAYNMSKSALDQFTRCIALELAPTVRVNGVNPGVIITDIHKRAGMDEDAYAKFLERAKSTHPLGRPGSAIEVAKSIAFLASEEASFTTGANFPIDGGRHAFGFR